MLHEVEIGAGLPPGTDLRVKHTRCSHPVPAGLGWNLSDRQHRAVDCDYPIVLADLDLGPGVITTAGVVALAAHTKNLSDFAYMDSGTGTNAESTGDTALQTPWGGSRTSISFSAPGSTNIEQSAGTTTYTNTFAITEWGRFSASSSGTLLDRRKFSAINVVNGDGISWTYQLTLPAGG